MKLSFVSIVPLLIFVAAFLGFGIYFNDFYAVPSPVTALLGVVSAFLLFRGNVQGKISTFLKGCGDGNILTMCLIYLFAGAFATVSKATGSIDSIVGLGLAYISPQYFAVGIFVIASFLSFASGTSVGAIVTLSPIVMELAEKSHSPFGIIGAALLCGAMFGDNLSVISDTTIAATQSLGCNMKDKFRANFALALPASIIAVILFFIFGDDSSAVGSETMAGAFNLWLIIPYMMVIVMSIVGINVFVSLLSGTVLAGTIGIINHQFDGLGFAKSIYDGFTGMTEIFLLSLLTGGLAAMVEKASGIQYLLSKVNKMISSPRSAMLGIGGLVSVANLCIANNTIAIIISGKMAKEIGEKYHLPKRTSASVLDIFACYVQGLIPYGAQVLFLISLSKNKVIYTELLAQAYYLHALVLITIAYILIMAVRKRGSTA